jgi:hypothetical protein
MPLDMPPRGTDSVQPRLYADDVRVATPVVSVQERRYADDMAGPSPVTHQRRYADDMAGTSPSSGPRGYAPVNTQVRPVEPRGYAPVNTQVRPVEPRGYAPVNTKVPPVSEPRGYAPINTRARPDLPPVERVVAAEPSRFDWSDASIGAGAMFLLLGLGAAMLAARQTRRGRPATV